MGRMNKFTLLEKADSKKSDNLTDEFQRIGRLSLYWLFRCFIKSRSHEPCTKICTKGYRLHHFRLLAASRSAP